MWQMTDFVHIYTHTFFKAKRSDSVCLISIFCVNILENKGKVPVRPQLLFVILVRQLRFAAFVVQGNASAPISRLLKMDFALLNFMYRINLYFCFSFYQAFLCVWGMKRMSRFLLNLFCQHDFCI